jgi:6-phosphofructokinase
MKNCIVAQSGGPTAVINSSAMGVLERNSETKYYDKVYAGINGIEGILQEKIIELNSLSTDLSNAFKYTPSSGLGSCRYKMKDFRKDDSDYKKLFEILDKLDIQTFFYIGGNDSMDTVYQLSEYAKEHNLTTQFLGIPKTIDNDLVGTDHCPGFGSAAKFVATVTLETYLDSSVYPTNGIFILETMGRDAGWLTASSALARIQGKAVADFIYLPETPFLKDKFLTDVKSKFQEQNQVFIVVSEGVRNENGIFLSNLNSDSALDKFGHIQLGGVCEYLKNLIIDNGITSRVKSLELGVLQRCAMHCASQNDIDEAFEVGKAALTYSTEGKSGFMVAINRLSNSPYLTETILFEAAKVANNIKYFPLEWINNQGNNILDDALEYFYPLIEGSPNLDLINSLPRYVKLK